VVGRLLPVYSLEAAAGYCSGVQQVEEEGWMEVPGRTLSAGMFLARGAGESMNRRIPNGRYCIFRAPVTGTRQGRVEVAQHRSIADPGHGGQYTVKVYESEKSIYR